MSQKEWSGYKHSPRSLTEWRYDSQDFRGVSFVFIPLTSYLLVDTVFSLGLLPSHHARTNLPSLPDTPHSPIDLLSILLSSELAYFGAERDAVILKHEVVTTSSTGISELFESSLVQVSDRELPSSRRIADGLLLHQYGVPGAASAMASTVGIVGYFEKLRRALTPRSALTLFATILLDISRLQSVHFYA